MAEIGTHVQKVVAELMAQRAIIDQALEGLKALYPDAVVVEDEFSTVKVRKQDPPRPLKQEMPKRTGPSMAQAIISVVNNWPAGGRPLSAVECTDRVMMEYKESHFTRASVSTVIGHMVRDGKIAKDETGRLTPVRVNGQD